MKCKYNTQYNVANQLCENIRPQIHQTRKGATPDIHVSKYVACTTIEDREALHEHQFRSNISGQCPHRCAVQLLLQSPSRKSTPLTHEEVVWLYVTVDEAPRVDELNARELRSKAQVDAGFSKIVVLMC